MLNPDHGGAGDMTGGVEGDAVAINLQLFVPVDRFHRRGLDAVTFHENVAGAARADDPLVAGEVIGMTVRDKGERHGAVWVECETGTGKVKEFRMELHRHDVG